MQNPKQLIEKIFNETGQSERDAENLANALTRLTGDLYTETERFIFELLQNADDIPNETGQVNVLFVILREHFLILHNGKPFDSTNVDAISSISKSTKVNNSEQTGYKGIGFKSVFADSECVYILILVIFHSNLIEMTKDIKTLIKLLGKSNLFG